MYVKLNANKLKAEEFLIPNLKEISTIEPTDSSILFDPIAAIATFVH